MNMKKGAAIPELIGKQAKVVWSTNKSLIGIEGIVVDETKHLLIIETKKGRKKIQKRGSVFEIDKKTIAGELIETSPQEQARKV